MALLAVLVSRLAGLTPLTTRLAARLVADPLRHLAGKPFERKLLVYDLPHRRLALANDPGIVETVLLDRRGTFPKSDVVEALLQPMIGAGLFGQPGGDAVRSARRLFIQALGRIGDDSVTAVARTLTDAYIARWRAEGSEIAVPREMSRLTVDIVSQVMLGHRFEPPELVRFVDLFFAYHKRAAPLLLMLAPQGQQVARRVVRQLGLEEIGAAMRALIRARFVQPIIEGDPVASDAPFARALMGADRPLPDVLLDQIAVMLLAGHETTASTMSWLLWELAGNPEQQDVFARLLENGPPARSSGSCWSSAAPSVIRAALVDEALRLYPPIAFFLRETADDLEFRGKEMRSGDFTVVSPWTLHRHRASWPEPDEFRPERWLRDDRDRRPASFLPFGFGARSCPGQRFAYLEMHEIVQGLLTECRFLRPPGAPPRPLGSLTSRPDREFVLRVEYRLPKSKAGADAAS